MMHVMSVLLLLVLLLLGCDLPSVSGKKSHVSREKAHVSGQKDPVPEWLRFDKKVPEGCPSWLKEYEQFHKSNKGKPGTKYLIYYCPYSSGGGFGDRMKGMHTILKLAYASKRVALFHWDFPAPLEKLLLPATFDWRLKGSGFGKNNITDKCYSILKWADHNKNKIRVEKLEDVEELLASDTQYLEFCIRHIIFQPISGGPPAPRTDMEFQVLGYCEFHTMFKPHPHVLRKAQKALKALFRKDMSQVPYTAIHWRQGGMTNEKRIMPRLRRITSKLELLRSLTRCAERLAGTRNINTAKTPILFLTDSDVWRQLAASKEVPHIVSPSVLAKHFHLSNTKLDDVFVILTELAMMAGSTCFISSRSGFSEEAMYWRGPIGCHTTVQTCWDEYEAEQKLADAAIHAVRAGIHGKAIMVPGADNGVPEGWSVAQVVERHRPRLEVRREGESSKEIIEEKEEEEEEEEEEK